MTATSDADGEEPSGPHPYFLAIEDVFLDLRGAPLQLSSKDWQVAKAWHEEGIPLELVERAIRELFARRAARQGEDDDADKVWSLAWCQRSVKAAWRRHQKLQAPASGGDEEALDVPARLANLAAALPEDLAGRDALAEEIRTLSGDAETVEARLTALDRELVRRVSDALSATDAADVERQLSASRAALSERLPAAELERAGERMREEVLRRRLGLPVLSLFAPEALPSQEPNPSDSLLGPAPPD